MRTGKIIARLKKLEEAVRTEKPKPVAIICEGSNLVVFIDVFFGATYRMRLDEYQRIATLPEKEKEPYLWKALPLNPGAPGGDPHSVIDNKRPKNSLTNRLSQRSSLSLRSKNR